MTQYVVCVKNDNAQILKIWRLCVNKLEFSNSFNFKVHPMFSDRVNHNIRPNRLSRILESRKALGQAILDLTQSNPTKIGLSYDNHRISTALGQPQGLIYEPDPCGLTSARNVISDYYHEIGADVDPGSIFLTASTSEAYGILFKLLGNPGDQILIPSPGYPLLSFLARFESLDVFFYPQRYAPGKGWYLDFDALEARITSRTRAIVAVSPNNPTGAYLKSQEISLLDQICCRHNLALIVDEVFFDYNDTCRCRSVLNVAGQCRALIFVLNGFSKMVALPQVKLGWIVAHGAAQKVAIAKTHLEMLLDFYLSVSAQVQHAVGGLMALRRDIQAQVKQRIALNQETLRLQLAETANCRMLEREGGWYAVVEVDDQWEDEERVLTLLTRDCTLVHPGYFYEFHREGFVVVSLLPPLEQFQKGIRHFVERFGRRYGI